MFSCRPIRVRGGLRLIFGFLALTALVSTAEARKKDPAFATSADDPVLRARISALSPDVDPEEAQRVAALAYTTGRELKKEWKVVWPPGLQNFLVNTGVRKGGLCFQWAERLLLRLADLKWETLEFHWAESFDKTASEHNVIVVTAKGQPFAQGILLDNWRYGGRLVWGPIVEDPFYQWVENKVQYQKVLNKRVVATPTPFRPTANSTPSAVKPDPGTR
ncbi:MAG: hypothetical protein WAO00_16995 [Chthoniobacterales bacterium]